MKPYKITIFGAGATGLAHLGLLLHQCGVTDLCYIEKRPSVVARLKEQGAYHVRLLSLSGGPEQSITVPGVMALGTDETERIVSRILESDLVLTAVIADNLPEVAPLVGNALAARMEAGNRTPLNIVCCENLDHASSLLKRYVYETLTDAQKAYADECIAFPDCMISRVVPVPTGDPLELVTEDYNEWTVDIDAIKGTFPALPCIELVSNLDARLERKLWIHNGGHATLAYMASLRGYPYVHVALEDPEVAAFTGKVLDEIGDCVRHKYPEFSKAAIRQYEQDLGMRGALAEMKDDIARVVRDPLRKLRLNDRLLAPALYAMDFDLCCDGLCRSILNATKYYHAGDAQSVKMREDIEQNGFASFVRQTLLQGTHTALADKLIAMDAEDERK